jgi:hypothetical protein
VTGFRGDEELRLLLDLALLVLIVMSAATWYVFGR